MTEEQYQRRERECIAEYDGGLTREEAEALAEREADQDPTPWCNYCQAPRKAHCKCGPLADND